MKDKYITITTTLVEPSVAVFALPRVALALFAPIVVEVFDTSTAAADLLARVDFGALHSSQSSVSSEFSEKVQTLQAQDVAFFSKYLNVGLAQEASRLQARRNNFQDLVRSCPLYRPQSNLPSLSEHRITYPEQDHRRFLAKSGLSSALKSSGRSLQKMSD